MFVKLYTVTKVTSVTTYVVTLNIRCLHRYGNNWNFSVQLMMIVSAMVTNNLFLGNDKNEIAIMWKKYLFGRF